MMIVAQLMANVRLATHALWGTALDVVPSVDSPPSARERRERERGVCGKSEKPREEKNLDAGAAGRHDAPGMTGGAVGAGGVAGACVPSAVQLQVLLEAGSPTSRLSDFGELSAENI